VVIDVEADVDADEEGAQRLSFSAIDGFEPPELELAGSASSSDD
jgi:hypothetical protein